MSASRIKALIKQVRGKGKGKGITANSLRNMETLIALSMLLDPKEWESMKPASRETLIKQELFPLMLELNACMWQAISEFYDREVTVETEIVFNNVRCRLSELQSSEKLGMPNLLATA